MKNTNEIAREIEQLVMRVQVADDSENAAQRYHARHEPMAELKALVAAHPDALGEARWVPGYIREELGFAPRPRTEPSYIRDPDSHYNRALRGED